VKALTEAELRLLVEKTPEDFKLLVELLAKTGLRVGEAFALRWQDIEGNRLCVRRRWYKGSFDKPKSKFGRRDVPLSPAFAKRLWAARKASQHPEDTALVSAGRNGRPPGYSNVLNRVLKPAAKAAGVPWVGFHTLRHTCASMLFRNGYNAKQVQKFLGHLSAAFTLDTYIHLLDDDLPEPVFFDVLTGGQQWATRPTEIRRNEDQAAAAV
jgi:integrase